MDWIMLVIAFILGAILMFMLVCIGYAAKQEEPVNKVRFFVTKDSDYYYRSYPILWIGLPRRGEQAWCQDRMSKPLAINKESFENLGINIDDFKDLKWEDEPVEVFINMEE